MKMWSIARLNTIGTCQDISEGQEEIKESQYGNMGFEYPICLTFILEYIVRRMI
jgi:hypothetical protein